MHTFRRPSQETLSVRRDPVTGASCPDCGGAVDRYPVLSEGGWWDVVKCRNCLASMSREPALPLGSFVPLGTTV